MILSVCPNPSIDCYAWLDDFRPGRVNRIRRLIEYPGGKGVHVALAIKELGENVDLFGFWAGGAGDWIQKIFSDKNIKISGISLEGNNRKCYTFRSTDQRFSNTEILEPGPEMKIEEWEQFKISFSKEINGASLISLSGSWPKNAPEDAYLQLNLLAQSKNKKVFLDCSGSQLEQVLSTSFFGLHLNEKEAMALCGSIEMKDLLKKLNNKVELVALTRGERGLLMSYKGKIYEANVAIDNVISTVGSGDCLTAGILWALQQEMDPKDIAAYGVACGAANCIHEELGMLKKEDVKKLFPKVKCKIINNDL